MDKVLHNEALTLFYRIFSACIPQHIRNKQLKYVANKRYANVRHLPYRITDGVEIVGSHVPFIQALDGETLFYCPEQDEIWSWNPVTGEKTMIHHSEREALGTEIICCYRKLSVSNDGQKIAACCIDDRVEYLLSGSVRWVLDDHGKPFSDPFHAAINTNGDRIVIIQSDGGYLLDETGKRLLYFVIQHKIKSVRSVQAVFSKSGRHVIVTLRGRNGRFRSKKVIRLVRVFDIGNYEKAQDEG